jgi:hypothetical protein
MHSSDPRHRRQRQCARPVRRGARSGPLLIIRSSSPDHLQRRNHLCEAHVAVELRLPRCVPSVGRRASPGQKGCGAALHLPPQRPGGLELRRRRTPQARRCESTKLGEADRPSCSPASSSRSSGRRGNSSLAILPPFTERQAPAMAGVGYPAMEKSDPAIGPTVAPWQSSSRRSGSAESAPGGFASAPAARSVHHASVRKPLVQAAGTGSSTSAGRGEAAAEAYRPPIEVNPALLTAKRPRHGPKGDRPARCGATTSRAPYRYASALPGASRNRAAHRRRSRTAAGR